ncbi:hypothetical protein cand_033020 [Cryptosporidium andersoni]|uniref:Uncharacterized protein n=1 Tax=Cryptosporidium andersoni TaxID=117008 RepID=A0A1J4MFH6_9CRYT|nr:hypothetical protein cand_033020 [Cryptosporidium andersoni]
MIKEKSIKGKLNFGLTSSSIPNTSNVSLLQIPENKLNTISSSSSDNLKDAVRRWHAKRKQELFNDNKTIDDTKKSDSVILAKSTSPQINTSITTLNPFIQGKSSPKSNLADFLPKPSLTDRIAKNSGEVKPTPLSTESKERIISKRTRDASPQVTDMIDNIENSASFTSPISTSSGPFDGPLSFDAIMALKRKKTLTSSEETINISTNTSPTIIDISNKESNFRSTNSEGKISDQITIGQTKHNRLQSKSCSHLATTNQQLKLKENNTIETQDILLVNQDITMKPTNNGNSLSVEDTLPINKNLSKSQNNSNLTLNLTQSTENSKNSSLYKLSDNSTISNTDSHNSINYIVKISNKISKLKEALFQSKTIPELLGNICIIINHIATSLDEIASKYGKNQSKYSNLSNAMNSCLNIINNPGENDCIADLSLELFAKYPEIFESLKKLSNFAKDSNKCTTLEGLCVYILGYGRLIDDLTVKVNIAVKHLV